MKTRTGGFPIGFRRLGSKWQAEIGATSAWARANGFEAIDLHADGDASAGAVTEAGLSVGTADLLDWRDMISADAGVRKAAADLVYLIDSEEYMADRFPVSPKRK